ncbi:MAG: hypothetical protein ACRDRI_11830 [Pseudonocardiaceae bacterium]
MIRLRLLSLLAAAALAVAALTGSVAVADTSAATSPNQQFSIGLPAGRFLLIGDVARPRFLDVAGLRAMPSKTVDVTFKGPRGSEHHVYVGPLLVNVIAQSGPQFDPAIKNDKLRHFVSVSATDGYRALVAYGEIDPNFEGKDVLLATSEDGRPLDADGPRLVVPGDISGGRYVTNVNRVFLGKPSL